MFRIKKKHCYEHTPIICSFEYMAYAMSLYTSCFQKNKLDIVRRLTRVVAYCRGTRATVVEKQPYDDASNGCSYPRHR